MATAKLGVALGCALLTKAYLLALIPLAVASVCLSWRDRKPRRALFTDGGILLMIVFGMSGWWYLRAWLLTGSVTGEQTEITALNSSVISLSDAVVQISWIRVADFLATSHIWLGGWSFLVLRSWMYRVIEVILAASAIGCVVEIVRNTRKASKLLLLSVPYFALLCGLCYQAIAAFMVSGKAGSMGYYLYALVPIEAVLLLTGLGAFLPSRHRPRIAGFLTIVMLGIESVGTWSLLIPYYCGLVQHQASGNVRALDLTQLSLGEVTTVVERLTANKPELITPVVIVVITILYLGANCILLILSLRPWGHGGSTADLISS